MTGGQVATEGIADAELPLALTPRDPVLPWASFGPILAVHFLGTLGFSLAIPFLVFIVTDLGGAAWTFGLVGATYSAFQLVGAPLLGRWSDRSGRRPVLVASQVGTLLAWLLFFFALSMPVTALGEFGGATLTLPLLLVFAARALDGATGGNISVANAYVADVTRDTPELRQLAFGRMGMAASLGFVIGPALAGVLGGTTWGPKLPIAVAAIFAAVTTVAIVALLREPPARCEKGPPDASMIEAGLGQQAKPCRASVKVEKRSRAALRRRPVVVILAATFTVFLGFNLFFAGFPVHALQAYGWNTGQLGAFFAVLSGMMFFAQGPVLTLASKHLSPRVVFSLGMAFLALAVASLQLPAGAVTYLGAAFFALGNGLAWPTFQTRVATVAGNEQGVVQGAVTSASSLASIIGLIAGGALYPVIGGGLFFVAAALFGLVLVASPVFFPREDDKSASAS